MKKYLVLLILMAFMMGSMPGTLLGDDQPAVNPISLSEVPDETDGNGDGNDDEDGGSEMIANEGEGDSGGEEDDDEGGSE